MKAFPIRTAVVALALIASFLFTPAKSNAQVKSTAAKAGAKAAKVSVVFNDVVKLADDIQKVSFRPNEEESDTVKDYIEQHLKDHGVTVADEDGDGVADLTFYIVDDDADDDNDGKPDASDDHEFSGEAPDTIKDSEIEKVDLDQTDPELRNLPDTNKTQGIYILVVNKTTNTAELFTLDEDVLGTNVMDSPSAFNLVSRPQPAMSESSHASFYRVQPAAGAWTSLALNAVVGLYKKYIR
jgi:hypothetical protein